MLLVELLITTAVGMTCVLMLQLELFNISQQHNSHHPTIQTFFCIYFNDFARFCRVFAFQCFINQYLVIFSTGISLIIRVITTMQCILLALKCNNIVASCLPPDLHMSVFLHWHCSILTLYQDHESLLHIHVSFNVQIDN